MGFAEVSTILWRERELLEVLLFKLEEERLVRAARRSRSRWLTRATYEVALVRAEIRHTEVSRALQVDAVAGALGLGPAPTLSVLAEMADDPWRTLMRDHRDAFLRSAAEVTRASGAGVTRSLADFLR
ncbi:MAG: flagellar protein FlgN [Actinomycetes bacterium]